jgi:hypothetical protein
MSLPRLLHVARITSDEISDDVNDRARTDEANRRVSTFLRVRYSLQLRKYQSKILRLNPPATSQITPS